MKVKHLKLNCSSIDEQRFFYTKKFRFEVVEESEDRFTMQVGDSLLTFIESRIHKSYYHFAFNVPYDALTKALKWAKKKVEIIRTKEGEIQSFPNWQAQAIYFLDPAGNIVELIGRENYQNPAVSAFSESSILNISEVGIPVFEVSSAYRTLSRVTGIAKFDCEGVRFCAAGDNEGLFILVDSAEKSWFPTDEPARPYNLEVDFEVDNRDFNLLAREGSLEFDEVTS